MLCIWFNVRWKALTLKNIFNTKYNAKKSKKVFRDFLSQKSWWKSMKVRNFEKSYWSWKLMIFYFFFIFTTFWRFQHMLCIRFNVRWKALTLKNVLNANIICAECLENFLRAHEGWEVDFFSARSGKIQK